MENFNIKTDTIFNSNIIKDQFYQVIYMFQQSISTTQPGKRKKRKLSVTKISVTTDKCQLNWVQISTANPGEKSGSTLPIPVRNPEINFSHLVNQIIIRQSQRQRKNYFLHKKKILRNSRTNAIRADTSYGKSKYDKN